MKVERIEYENVIPIHVESLSDQNTYTQLSDIPETITLANVKYNLKSIINFIPDRDYNIMLLMLIVITVGKSMMIKAI